MTQTFADIDTQYSQLEMAEVVLIPVPYDETCTWMKGAAKGPDALLEAARNMELYDIEIGGEIYKRGIYLEKPLNGFRSPNEMVKGVYRCVKQHLSKDKFVTIIGGEHSVSIGAIRAYCEKYKDLTVVQLDAHTDLRREYNGSPYNHACAMAEASQSCNLLQVGIRSMDLSEKAYLDSKQVFFAHDIYNNEAWFQNVIDQATNDVYITIDLDVFDPSIMPSTGTPEPGGLGWYTVLHFLKKVMNRKHVVGFDIVELCPNDTNKAPDFLAAKLYYKLLSYQFFNNGHQYTQRPD